MQRRDFLKKASVGAAAGAAATLAAPAIANELPSIKWRLTSSFPKSLDTIYGGAEQLAARIKELTGGKFEIRVFAGGEIVPGLQAMDAVQQGTVECCHTASFYYVGKDRSFAFGTALPFGINARQTNAWMYYGGGQELLDEFYAGYNLVSFPGPYTHNSWSSGMTNIAQSIPGRFAAPRTQSRRKHATSRFSEKGFGRRCRRGRRHPGRSGHRQ